MSVVVSHLLEQEQIIERGLASFVEVGNALMRIREEELYRQAGFDGFVDYLDSKPWGIQERRAYQMIEASSVCKILQTPAVESQARELAPLMRRATPGVVQQVYAEVIEETGGRPTAGAIRDKVQQTLREFSKPKEQLSQERPTQHLPDLLDEDSPRNLRTQVVRWCELGRHIESLLDNRAKLEAKSEEDARLIHLEMKAMCELAQKLERRLK